MTLRSLLLLATLLLMPGCGVDTASESSREGRAEVTVSRVIDGDTVEVTPTVEGEEDVRLIGVDTPETAGSPGGAQPYGEKASRFTRQALEGERVTLRFDEEKKDDYGTGAGVPVLARWDNVQRDAAGERDTRRSRPSRPT